MSRIRTSSLSLLVFAQFLLPCWLPRSHCEDFFRRGDCNVDGAVDISDAIFILNTIISATKKSMPCWDAADVNDDGSVDLSDSFYIFLFLFIGNHPPPEPFGRCDFDPTPDSLDCASFDSCLQPEIIMQDGVVILDPQSATITGIAGEIVTITGNPPDLEPEQILVSGQGQGLLRRIDSVERKDDETILRTSPATLADIFKKATIELQSMLAHDAFASFTPASEGVSFTRRVPSGEGAIDLRFADADLNLALNLHPDPDDPETVVEVTGDIFFAVELRFRAGIDVGLDGRAEVRDFLFEPRFTVRCDVDVKCYRPMHLVDPLEVSLGTLTGAPIVVSVGPVPVVFTPVIDCSITVEGDLEVGVEFSPSASLAAAPKVEYAPEDGWRASSSHEEEFDLGFTPDLFGAVEARFGLFSPKLSLNLYGMMGPHAQLDAPFFRLGFKSQADPCLGKCSADAGLQASIGAGAEVLDDGIISEEHPGAIDFRTTLYERTFPCEEQVRRAWVARHNGTENLEDVAEALAIDGVGNVYVTGWSTTTAGYQYATIKYSTDGKKLWTAPHTGMAMRVAVDGAGNVYVTGQSRTPLSTDYATVKYDSNGKLLWASRYDGPEGNEDFATSLAVDVAGNVYVTGLSIGDGTDFDIVTIKYDADGKALWVARYDGPAHGDDFGSCLAVDGAGNVYVTGTSIGVGTDFDYATIKYDSDGRELWVARYDGPGNRLDAPKGMAIDGAGNVYVTGGSIGAGTDYDYATIKYGTDGRALWVARYDGPGNNFDHSMSLAVDGAGNVCVTGWSTGAGLDLDYATIKYDPDGHELWVARYDGPDNTTDTANGLVLDCVGNIYVTGMSYSVGTGSDYATVKYDPDGRELWVDRYDGPAHHDDSGNALAVDGAGNVYVTGYSLGTGGENDFATIKYDLVR